MSWFKFQTVRWKSPRVLIRVGLGVLLVADLVAAAIVFKPWAGSAEDLARQAEGLRQQVLARQTAVEKTRALVKKVESARVDGDHFSDAYLLSNRTMASNLVDELYQTARKAGIKQKEAAFAFEPIEGSETLSKVTITAGYEGTFADLMHFINLLDRSPRFLIIESLQASPQQSGLTLGATMKLNVFVREGGPPTPLTPASQAEASQPEPPAAKPAAAEPPAAPKGNTATPAAKAEPKPAAPVPVLPAPLRPAIESAKRPGRAAR